MNFSEPKANGVRLPESAQPKPTPVELRPGSSLPKLLIGRSERDFGEFTPEEGELKREQGWHRQAAYLLLSGKTVKKVAQIFEKTPATITNLLKNTWFQRIMTEVSETEGAVDVMQLIRAEALSSLGTMIELRDNLDVSPTVRSNIAMNLLDRAYGKPVQKVEATTEIRSTDPVKEAEQIQKQISHECRTLGLSAPEGQDGPDAQN